MSLPRPFLLAGFCALILVGSARAQDQPPATFRALQSRLARLAEVDSVLALERRVLATAPTRRGDPVFHLELGVIALRLGEMTQGTRHYEDAEEEFASVVKLRPTWWEARYGRGLARVGVRSTELGIVSRIKELAGQDADALAAADLAASAALDSSRAEGLIGFVRDALRTRAKRPLEVAQLALAGARDGPAGRLLEVRLLSGVLERSFDRFDAALTHLEPLAEEQPDNAEVLLELAETRFVAGRLDGVDAWYRAIARADSALMERLRLDLVLVMPDSVMRAFLHVPVSGRVDVARDFWESQERSGLPVTSERVRDHYRRLKYARNQFRRTDPMGLPLPLPGMRDGTEEFDARGRVVVLHGVPTSRTHLGLPGVNTNESWAYAVGEDTLLFHFIVPQGRRDPVLVESVLDLFALSGQARFMATPRDTMPDGSPVIESYGASLTAQTMQELYVSREPISPLYTRLFNEGRSGASTLQAAERRVGTESIAANATWALSFEIPLTADVVAVGVGEGGSGRLIQIGYAIPGRSTAPVVTMGGVYYQVRLRAAVRDTAGRVVATIDTIRTFRTSGVLLPHERLLGRSAVAVPPGLYRVHVALETERRGLVMAPATIDIPAMDRSILVLSELVLGHRRMPIPVPTASGDSAWINPTGSFQRDTPMELFLEVGGVPRGERYRVELSIVRPATGGFLGGKDRSVVTMAWAGVHPGGVSAITREVKLNRLDPGTYRLEVVVIAVDGSRAMRQREFTVVR